MKIIKIALLVITTAIMVGLPLLLLGGCTTQVNSVTGKKQLVSTLTIEQRKHILSNATALAGLAAGLEGGPAASAGLNAFGVVAQGFVGKLIPSKDVAAAPGVGSLGANLAVLMPQDQPVTQTQVNTIFNAAALARNK